MASIKQRLHKRIALRRINVYKLVMVNVIDFFQRVVRNFNKMLNASNKILVEAMSSVDAANMTAKEFATYVKDRILLGAV